MAFQEHERVWERTPSNTAGSGGFRPMATYALLAAMAVVYIAEIVIDKRGNPVQFHDAFTIDADWAHRPWSLVTATFSHSVQYPMHIVFNGLTLFFLAPTIERVIGPKRLIALFILAGALTGLAQVYVAKALHEGRPALGASGAIMMLLGILVMLFPKTRALLFGLVPVPLWAMGVLYAILDVIGAFNPDDGLGNFAHLSGLALGLAYGVYVKLDLQRRGLKWVSR